MSATETQADNASTLEPWRDPTAEPFIRIENVTKRFGEIVAVNNVSLDVYQRELFALLGGSGCGKSTLLRMLAGFETPTQGRILIDGQDMGAIPPYERPVNMMFQSYALFPHMTVAGNVAYGLKQERTPAAEITQRVEEVLSLVQLEGFGKRKPHQLSGGQRQRVALARALVKKPKLLLLDEPLGALDKKLREETQFELMGIQEQSGVTFVVVTHDQEEAMTLATRIGVMDEGRIVQIGRPAEIYEFPNSRFVADFIGSVNIFEGRLTEDAADHVVIASDEAGCDIFVDHGVSAARGARVSVAIRPEKMRITRERPAAEREGANIASAVVSEIAYMGSHSVFELRLESGKKVRVSRPNLAREQELAFDWDERVHISWSADAPVVLTS